MTDQRTLVLQQRAIEALRERIVAESYVGVAEVCKRLKLSREKVESLPMAILPYVDHGSTVTPKEGEPRWRSLRRYHPADVLAADARIRAWRRAETRGGGDAYLARLEAELDESDRAAIDLARTTRSA